MTARHPAVKGWLTCLGILLLGCVTTGAIGAERQGEYFAKKAYVPSPLPKFAETKDQLPSPVYDENPRLVRMYWHAWELAFRNFYEPTPGSGFVSQFVDAAFNQNIFLWDTCFLTMFCNYGQPLVPGIASLDNFYAKQHADGEICREIDRTTGCDFAPWVNTEHKNLFSRWDNFSVNYVGREIPCPPPRLTLDALNHPLLAWAELESIRVTGDRSRLGIVYEPLVRYYRALQKYLRQGNGLYVTDWASMDNSPRNAYLTGGGTAVDTSSEMVLFGKQLAEIAELLDKKDEAAAFRCEAEELARTINAKMWNPERKFYFDLTVDGRQAPAKTIAAYWTLLAKVASPEQADALAAELVDPQSFGRKHRVPTTPADQEGFDPAGGYWRGAVWTPTNTMVIRGLERYGRHALARQIAMEDLRIVSEVFEATGTLWENYAPDAAAPGKPAKPDFVGWTGIVPIVYFLEYAIGLKPDAPNNRLTWTLTSTARAGCQRYRFNGHTTTLVAEPPDTSRQIRLSVESDGPYRLRVERGDEHWEWSVEKGKNAFVVEGRGMGSGAMGAGPKSGPIELSVRVLDYSGDKMHSLATGPGGVIYHPDAYDCSLCEILSPAGFHGQQLQIWGWNRKRTVEPALREKGNVVHLRCDLQKRQAPPWNTGPTGLGQWDVELITAARSTDTPRPEGRGR